MEGELWKTSKKRFRKGSRTRFRKRFCVRESGSKLDIVIAFILLGRGRGEYGKVEERY